MTVKERLEWLLRVDKTPLYCAAGSCASSRGQHRITRAELEELVEASKKEGVIEYVAKEVIGLATRLAKTASESEILIGGYLKELRLFLNTLEDKP